MKDIEIKIDTPIEYEILSNEKPFIKNKISMDILDEKINNLTNIELLKYLK